ncbi:hypothetical protein HK101_000868, partial [Irineochytrium annulatum]
INASDLLRDSAVIRLALNQRQHFESHTLPRQALVDVCRWYGLNRFGFSFYLRRSLRKHADKIREDDRYLFKDGFQTKGVERIVEGEAKGEGDVKKEDGKEDGVSMAEVRIACEERGINTDGRTDAEIVEELQAWLKLTCNDKTELPLPLLAFASASRVELNGSLKGED